MNVKGIDVVSALTQMLNDELEQVNAMFHHTTVETASTPKERIRRHLIIRKDFLNLQKMLKWRRSSVGRAQDS